MRYLNRKPAIVFALFAATVSLGGILVQLPSASAQINRVDDLEQMDLEQMDSEQTEPPVDAVNPVELTPVNPTPAELDPVELDPVDLYPMELVPAEFIDRTGQDERLNESVNSQSEPEEEVVPAQQQLRAWNQNLYDRAKSELSEELYTLYRIVDRLSRANGLDESSWQINLVDEATPSPAAHRANRIVINSALFDQLHGDVHALACVVGREMAHNVQGHTVMTVVERDRVLAQLQAEAETEVEQEFATDGQPEHRSSLGGAVLRGVGQLFGGVGTVVTGVANSLIENERAEQAAEQAAERQQRMDEIYQAKVAEVERQWAELAYEQTLAADRGGYEYMISAGFDPQGCIRAIQVMPPVDGVIDGVANRAVTNAETNAETSEPSASTVTADRLKALQSRSPQQEQFVTQGELNLEESAQALAYESFGANQLRVHSRLGQQGIDQILAE
jgi:stress-induced morphogen